MTLVGNFNKAPAEVLDYEIDLGQVLAGDSIAALTWVSSVPYELVVGSGQNGLPAPETEGTTVKVWVGGGVPGRFYTVQANVQTTGGRVFQRGFGVQVTSDAALAHTPSIRRVRHGVGALSFTSNTTLRTALIAGVVVMPALWLAGRAFNIKGLTGWRLTSAALIAAAAVALGMLAWDATHAHAEAA